MYSEIRYKTKNITEYERMTAEELILELKKIQFVKKMSAIQIQRAFKNAISNPQYKMCKQRLMREYQELTS